MQRLIASCLNDACRHVALIDVSSYPADTEVPYFGNKVVCAKCGSRGNKIDVRPNWKGQPTRFPIRASGSGKRGETMLFERRIGAVLVVAALISASCAEFSGAAERPPCTGYMFCPFAEGAQPEPSAERRPPGWYDDGSGALLTDPKVIAILNEQVRLRQTLPADVPDTLIERLAECGLPASGDPREYLRCQDVLRDYDAWACRSHLRTETGPAYDQCRAELANRRELNRRRPLEPPVQYRPTEPNVVVVTPPATRAPIQMPSFEPEPLPAPQPLNVLPPRPIRCQPSGYGSFTCR